jgi:iron complex transport system ATP-binding protein
MELSHLTKDPDKISSPGLYLQNISVMRAERLVLRDITLNIDTGERIAILGPNGSGKSSLIKVITRECYPISRPNSLMTIFGHRDWNIFELRTLLGIVSSDLAKHFDYNITGREAVISGFFSRIGLSIHDDVTTEMERKTEDILSLLGTKHLAERPLAEMSTGEARRILIGRALVHSPKMLILDEPSTGLDMRAHRDLLSTLSNIALNGTGILMVTHDFKDIIPEITRVLFIRDGSLVADGARDLLLTNAHLSMLFDTNVRIV